MKSKDIILMTSAILTSLWALTQLLNFFNIFNKMQQIIDVLGTFTSIIIPFLVLYLIYKSIRYDKNKDQIDEMKNQIEWMKKIIIADHALSNVRFEKLAKENSIFSEFMCKLTERKEFAIKLKNQADIKGLDDDNIDAIVNCFYGVNSKKFNKQ